MLARCGVGKLLLVDYDVVDVSNLNRQEYDIRHIGIKRLRLLHKDFMRLIHMWKLPLQNIRITKDNAANVFSGYEYICEAFDQAEEKAMLINTLLSECPDAVIVSGNGMAGLSEANLIKTRKAAKRLYICGDETADISFGTGLTASRVSICAGHQAHQIIRLILGREGNI